MAVWSVIAEIIALLAAALILGAVAQRLRQSAVVGYLLAGLLLGPSGFGVIDDPDTVRTFAELGVVMLIFSIGLELPAARIRKLGPAVLLAGVLQIAATIVLFALGARLFGVPWSAAWAIGLIAAPSSTAFVIRLLEKRAELDSLHGRTAIGILLLQDAALVPLIVIMSLLGEQGGESTGPALLLSVGRMAGLMLILFLAIRFVMPIALDRATVYRNREFPLLLAIVVVLSAAWASHALHISPVLGAFVAGVLLAESPFAVWVRADVGSLRTVFLTLFFASLAMLDDISWVRSHFVWLLVSVPAVLLFKALMVVAVTAVTKLPMPTRIATGLCLAQTGEFSFVLAQIGTDNGVLSADWNQLIIATTVLALFVTPYLLPLAARMAGRPGIQPAEGDRPAAKMRDHVVVIGFGPAGRTVYQSLVNRVPMTIVELNPRIGRFDGDESATVITGDATQELVLAHAGVDRARAVVVTIPDHKTALSVIRLIAALAPDTPIISRSRFHRYAGEFHAASTDVVDEELAVGDLLADRVARALSIH
jgi:CPA2 family monovalent cation:H+ antiporter-2